MKLLLCLFLILYSLAGSVYSQGKANGEFEAFLVRADAAQIELQNGKAEAYKAVWSHSDDVTLSGGFGGAVEKGWSAVSKRLDWVGANFSKGKTRSNVWFQIITETSVTSFSWSTSILQLLKQAASRRAITA